ncbi:asparaginase [Kingella negevensis]|uniref:asparaginase n=1 Tax=Kingella negevensis TaxID=1522312 RepID=UPI00254B38D2|nr:asparaginase [Kingella negevensis]MDK4680537.1 asparaginase [Kingella negevensis]MDK4681740.1 asparaginase [Kingella negevensis]MDK4689938.1 asparaginase [Kingella negevensis]MDK4692718.1 asparaginase [Kingella negevensis]MDK4699017.1 asparaginase [Kingella negevensis]
MKRIFVLYTGGTIGMVQSELGLRPDKGIVNSALAPFSGCLKCDWFVCEPLIDSSAVSPKHWADWLRILQAQLPRYDGALILHGTDTLAYTANVLALALDTLGKPVVLTGSQKPFDHVNSDAPDNLQTAVAALLRDDVREVLLAFNGKLFPAVGCSKVSTETDDGFANAHFGEWQPESGVAPFSGCVKRVFNPDVRVANVYLTPVAGVQAAAFMLDNFGAAAAIVQSFGHGNAPDDANWLAAMRRFTQQGKVLLNISQVPQGCAAAVYAQGSALRQAGAIQGGKCNIETAVALAMLAAANDWSADDVAAELARLRLI